ncbi:MAG: hypothetical protein J1D77_06975 [Muribaculaceae bacterium]|nr:hypothetical protein [Muribaculaceae bacterium]
MKIRNCLASLSLVLGIGAMMATPSQYVPGKVTDENLKGIQGTTKFKGNAIGIDHKTQKAPATRAAHYRGDVITEAPGTPQLYSKECGGTTYSWLFGMSIYEQTYPATIVWDGNDVYFANILFNAPYGGVTYVKGTKSGDKVSVPVPQTLIWYDDELYGLNLVVLKLNPNAALDGNTYIVDESITSFEYELAADGSVKLALSGGYDGGIMLPEHVLGVVLTDENPNPEENFDGAWNGFTDFYQTYTPFLEEPEEMPSDAEPQQYGLVITDYGFPVSVVFQNDKVYFQGMCQSVPEGVIYGDLSEGENGQKIITIPQNQYVGIYQEETFVYTKKVYVNPEFEEEADPESPSAIYMLLAPENEGYRLIYDPAANTFTSADHEYYLCFNSGTEKVSFVDIIDPFTMNYRPDFNGTPQNPYGLAFDDSQTDAFGYSSFGFTIPCLSTEGNLLDTDNIFYSVYVDGDKWEFVEDEIIDMNGYPAYIYWDVAEEMDEIPLTFNNGWDIYKPSDNSVSIGFYVEGFSTLGVQTIYKYNGETTTSALVTLDIDSGEITPDAGVDSVGIGMEAISVEYFDLHGRRIANPSHGIFLKKTHYQDGSVKTKKIIRK